MASATASGWKSYVKPIKNPLSSTNPHNCSFCPTTTPGKTLLTRTVQNELYKLRGHQCESECTTCWHTPFSYVCQKAVCQTCLDLDFLLFPEADKRAHFRYSDWVTSCELSERRYILTTIANLRQCSVECCRKCAILLKGLDQMSTNLGDSLERIEEDEQDGGDLNIMRISLDTNGTLIVEFTSWTLEFYTPPDSPVLFPAFGKAAPMPLFPSVDYANTFIQSSLQQCKEKHSMCMSANSTLPTRVLDVGAHFGTKSVKLVETNTLQSTRISYWALSHCWGPASSIPRTTSSTYVDYLSGIPWNDLPKTFLDAIALTQAAQIRYLWIDSLCIIQDVARDWEMESSRMAQIYANSELVIAAAGAIDSSVGCLFDRWQDVDAWKSYPADVKSPRSGVEIVTCIDGVPSKVMVRLVPIAAHEDTSFQGGSYFESAALAKRAWVFQERVLAPRTIHFHYQEMIWECRATTNCECSLLTRPIDNERGETLKALFNGRRDTAVNMELYHRIWMEIIATFSTLRITYEIDRLPALSGLASCFSESTGSKYLAGLWETDLPRALLWKTGAYQNNTRSPSPRPPTWSWASVITGTATSTESPDGVLFELGLYVTATFVQDPRVVVFEAKCSPLGNNRFGRVYEGSIRICGPLLPVTIISGGTPRSYQMLFGGMGSSFLPDISNEDHLAREEKTIFCLLIGGMRDAQCEVANSYQYGLVLKKVSEKRYERLGRMAIDPYKNWFTPTNAPVCEVILV